MPSAYVWLQHRLQDGWWCTHAALALVLTSIARTFYLPPATFPVATSYDGFAALATEYHWSLILFALAVLGGAGLFVRRGWMLAISTATLCGAHIMIAGLVLWANPNTAVGHMFVILALLSLGRLVRGSDA